MSCIPLRLQPQIAHGNETLAFQPVVAHRHLGRLGFRQVPVALAADPRQDRLPLAYPQRQQVPHLGPHPAPLFPVAHANAAAQPLVKLRDRSVVLALAEVPHPAPEVLGELAKPVVHRHAPASPGQFPDAVLEVGEGRLRPSELGTRCASVGFDPFPRALEVDGVEDLPHQVVVQGWRAGFTRHGRFPGRVRRDQAVGRGSSLSVSVRPFAPSWRLIRPLLTSAGSRRGLPLGALWRALRFVAIRSAGYDAPRSPGPGSPRGPSGICAKSRPSPLRQISPNKNMSCPCTSAAFTLSPVPGGLRCHVPTRPGTEPSMRFLSVASHFCTRASFRHPLAGLPLPSASGFIWPKDHFRDSHRGLPPHKFMPMSGVHPQFQPTPNGAAERDR